MGVAAPERQANLILQGEGPEMGLSQGKGVHEMDALSFCQGCAQTAWFSAYPAATLGQPPEMER